MRWNAPFMAVKAAIKRLVLKPFRTFVRFAAVTALVVVCWIIASRIIESRPVEATSSDPAIAVRQERVVHGVRSGCQLRSGARASQGNRHSRADLFWVGHLLRRWKIGERSFPARGRRPNAFAVCESSALRRSSPDSIAIEGGPGGIANANVGLQLDLMDDITTPCLVIVTPRGEFVTKRQGYQNPRDMAAFLKRAVAQARHRSSARGTNP